MNEKKRKIEPATEIIQKASDSDEANRTHGRAGSQASHRLEHGRGACGGRRSADAAQAARAEGYHGPLWI